MKYYKVLNQELNHHGFQYVENALNVDTLKFNPSGECESGGLYFTREDIFNFLKFGIYLCEVTIPEDAKVYENPGPIIKWKADKIILGEKKKIDLSVIRALIEEGANTSVEWDRIMEFAIQKDDFEILKYAVEEAKDIWEIGSIPLIISIVENKYNMFEYLINNGVDMHAFGDYALLTACTNKNFPMIKKLVNIGANINARYGAIIEAATQCIDILKYLVENGANIYGFGSVFAGSYTGCLRSAVIFKNFEVIEYLVELFIERGKKPLDYDIAVTRIYNDYKTDECERVMIHLRKIENLPTAKKTIDIS